MLLEWWVGLAGFWPLAVGPGPRVVGVPYFGWFRVLGCGAVWDGVSRLFGVSVVVCPLWCGVGVAGFAGAGWGLSFFTPSQGVWWQCL